MSNPTSNFGWQMPTATDLVTDLPADFEVFGQAVDTSLADLKGGTTGQILSKTTNADMDFVWITNDVGDITAVTAGTGITGGGTSGAVTITNDMATTITASGDIVVGTGSGTYDNLPIGTTGQILTADTTVSPYKVKWATPAGGGKVLQVVSASTDSAASSSSTTFATTNVTASITPTLSTSKVLVLTTINGVTVDSTANQGVAFKLYRGSTQISLIADAFLRNSGNTFITGTLPFTYLDSPATTSSTSYTVQFARTAGSGTVYCQNWYTATTGASTITLLEIGA